MLIKIETSKENSKNSTGKQQKLPKNQRQYMHKARFSGLTYILAFVLPCVVLAILTVIFYLGVLPGKGIRMVDMNDSDVQVVSGDDLVKGLIANSSLGSGYRNKKNKTKTYVLKDNIELSEDNVKALRNINFYGVLDGGGHTITTNQTLTQPLIDTLAEGAVIKRIEFLNLNISPTVADASVVKNNYGELSDIRVKNATITIDSGVAVKTGAVAALTSYNYGTVTRCVIDATVSINANFTTDQYANRRVGDWKCSVAGAVAENCGGGKINNVIVDISYPQDFVVLDKKNAAVNSTVGLAVGRWVEEPNFKNVWVIASEEEKDGISTTTDIQLATSQSAAWSLKTLQNLSYNVLKTEWKDNVENSVWDIVHDGVLPEFSEEVATL